jgi:hypothetical protein
MAQTKAASVIARAWKRFKSRKKRIRPRAGGRAKFVMYNKLLQPRIRTKLIYCDTKTLAPGTADARHLWNIRSIYDPDATGVGHQPAFFDKWAALYDNYRVTYTKWYLTFASYREDYYNTATMSDAVTRPYSDSNHYDEQRNPGILFWEATRTTTADKTQSADKNVIRETASGTRNVQYRMTSGHVGRVYKMRGGVAMKDLAEDPEEVNHSAAVTGNPAQGYYLHVGCMSKDGGNMSKFRVDIRLEYFVEYTDAKSFEDEN